MKRRITSFRIFIIAILALFISVPVLSQPSSEGEINDGKEYWLGIAHCLRDRAEAVRWGVYPVELWVSSRVQTKATVESLDGSMTMQTFVINKNEIRIIPISDFLENTESEVVTNKGIHIVGEDPISVGVFVAYKWSGEAYRVTPVEWLGKKYFTLNMYQDQVAMWSHYTEYKPASILIIATEDQTNVSYSPACETQAGVLKGQTKTIKMRRGQTFLIESKIKVHLNHDWSTDLSGTKIEANKPIAVISGHTKAAFPIFSTSMLGMKSDFMRNMLMDMMWPVSLLGKEYVSAPIKYLNRYFNTANQLQNMKGDLMRFVATEDGTKIYKMREDGSGWMQFSPTMKEGQWIDRTSQQTPAYYKANKRILVGQYGKAWWSRAVPPLTEKDGDDDQIQNPPRNGQGMMFALTPIEQWCSDATFRSVPGMDNFVYVTFYTKDLKKLYFDGYSFYQKFGTAVQYIEGSEFSYVTQQISAGDHFITADSGAKFAGYAYGNWDGSKDGFAYGYPIGINYAISCEDSLVVEDEMDCGDVVGTATALPEDSSCAIIFNIQFLRDQSYNYEFDVDDYDPTKDQVVNFYLDVIDIREPAHGVVKITTRSGKSVIKEYDYIPEQIAVEPGLLDFGLLTLYEKKCLDITLSNPGTVDVTVKHLKLLYNMKEFEIDISGLPQTIPPGGKYDVEVCATALETYTRPVIDSIIAELLCFEEPLNRLELKSGSPVIWISDAHWGQLPVGVEKPRDVEIHNQGTVTAELYTIDWPDQLHFTKVENLNFPLYLEPGESHNFQAFYMPDVPGVVHSTRATFTGNTDQIKLYSDWDGSGILAGPLCEGYDWGRRRVIDAYADSVEYKWSVMIDNTGNTKLDVISVVLEEDFNGVFRLDDSKVPQQINPNSPIYLDAFFAPKEGDGIEEYQTKVIFTAEFNEEVKTAEGILHGIEMQPHINVDDLTFPTPILIGTSEEDFDYVESLVPSEVSKMPLTIFDLTIEGADADAFEIKAEFWDDYTAPFTIEPGGNIPVPIRFTAKHAGAHTAQLVPVSDAPEKPIGELLGYGYSTGLVTTHWPFGMHFITKASTGAVTLTNNGTVPATITDDLQVSGADYNNFFIKGWHIDGNPVQNPTAPFDLGAGETLIVDVEFIPMEVREYNAQIEYINNTEPAVSLIDGEGMILKTICKIPDYTMFPGDPLEIEVKIEKHAEETKPLEQGGITAFKCLVYFNTENPEVIDVYPEVTGPQDIITAGTMTQGWDVLYAGVFDKSYLLVEFENSSGQPLAGSGTLFKFMIYSYLSDLDYVPLQVEFAPTGTEWVEVTNEPGSVTVQPVCVNTLRQIKVSVDPYGLFPCKPNPVKDLATIEYSVGLELHTTIELFNTFGQKAATFVDEILKPGHYELNFNVNALCLPSGVYQYRIKSGPFSDSKTMVIAK